MIVTNGEIYGAIRPLRELAQKQLPMKQSYQVLRLVKALRDDTAILEQMRTALIDKYGVKNQNGVSEIKPEHANWDAFLTDFNELMGTEVEVDFDPIVLPETVDGEEFKIDAVSLEALEKFIDMDVDKKETKDNDS